MIKGLEPIYDNNSRILILGSLPGEISLNKKEYYGNPNNSFWRLLSLALENKELVFNNYNEKKNFLKKHHIALWDVIKLANREGSLDSNIKNEEYNALKEFIKKNNIEKVFINGSKAEQSLKRYCKINKYNINYVKLPSSSPANASISFEEKKKAWKVLIT